MSALLTALPGPSMLIGGLAVIAHGHIRSTDDIDATAPGQRVTPEQILSLAAAHEIHPRIDDSLAFARRTQVPLQHRPTGVHVDPGLAWLLFEEEALARQIVVRFHDLDLHVCDPEDLIVYKVVATRPVDLDDARQLAMRHRARIDRERVRRTLREFDEVLEDGRSRVAKVATSCADAFCWLQVYKGTHPSDQPSALGKMFAPVQRGQAKARPAGSKNRRARLTR